MPSDRPSPRATATLLASVLLATACSSGEGRPPHLSWVTPYPLVAEPGAHDVSLVDTRAIVPGDGLPSEVVLGQSNNNLDVARHQGRTYLAFRTAPNHFAGTETRMYVVSSTDEVSWDYEYEVALGTDIREPRLLSMGDTLFFFFSVLGTRPLAFEPAGVRVVEKTASGWGPIEDHATDDRIVWRTRMHEGVAYLSSYTGGIHEYTFDGLPLDVQFMQSTDGRAWTDVRGVPSLYHGGASEMDFAWDDEGDLWFVLRTEAWDPSGTGSKLCVARDGHVESLYCRSDPKKYDSPLLFAHDGEIYLVGRRNLTETGYFADPTIDFATAGTAQVFLDQLEYRDASKRCALWRIDRDAMRVAYLLDFPSNGDTCFASVIPGSTPDELVVYNYSSDPNGGDLSWVEGQEGPTSIYRHVLRFTPR